MLNNKTAQNMEPDTATLTKPWCHPGVLKVLNKAFFDGDSPASLLFKSQFNQVTANHEPALPMSMIAFGGTAVI